MAKKTQNALVYHDKMGRRGDIPSALPFLYILPANHLFDLRNEDLLFGSIL